MARDHTSEDPYNHHLDIKLKYIPIVDCEKNMNLLFMIKTEDLLKECKEHFGDLDTFRPTKLHHTQMKLLHKANAENDQEPLQLNAMSQIILGMKKYPPPVLYEDAPLSYLNKGSATLFYTGEGEELTNEIVTPEVLIYYVIRPVNDEFEPVNKI